MDANFESVNRLYAQGVPTKAIAKRLHVSEQKVRKILITLGIMPSVYVKELNERFKAGSTIEELSEMYDITPKTVSSMLPYQKCQYNAEYPTINAIKVRKTREKKKLAK